MMTYFRVQAAWRDVNDLLDPAEQVSRAWHRDDLDRDGVSVCESREDLARYLATVGEGIPFGAGEWVVVELTGTPSDAEPLDADDGELLLHPTGIVSVRSMDDDGMFDLIGDVLDELEGVAA